MFVGTIVATEVNIIKLDNNILPTSHFAHISLGVIAETIETLVWLMEIPLPHD